MVALQTTVVPVANSPRDSEVGSILISPDGRIVKLNGVGTLIWNLLESCGPSRGLTLTEIVSELQSLDPSDVPDEFNNEIRSFLTTLVAKGLLKTAPAANGESQFFINDAVIWSGHPFEHSFTPSKTNAHKPHLFKSEKLQTLQALFWLVVYAGLVRLKGFAAVHRLTKSPVRLSEVKRQSDEQACLQVCEAVDRAQVYLFRQALCLQRSVVISRLLRARGVAAQVVIAAHLMPFKSHAWVEVDRLVINDSQNVQRYYDVIIARL
jgi:Transglutaminase-like superfamily/Coenzyme PQQ synthesis protein D (PqqD)